MIRFAKKPEGTEEPQASRKVAQAVESQPKAPEKVSGKPKGGRKASKPVADASDDEKLI